ncbi:MAG: aspartate kinase [Bacteroidota bacterium]
MIVMKFGGTSVQDARAMKNVGEIISQRSHQPLVVVSSACAGVTNALLNLAAGVRDGHTTQSLEAVELLRQRHRKIAHELLTGEILLTVQSQVDAMMDELGDIVRSIAILGELTNRSLDTFASFGEKLSTLLLSHHLHQIGVNAVLLNAQEFIITNNDFTQAIPLFDEIDKKVNDIVVPKLTSGHVVVTQGFLGATASGIPTTIGRGGSDYSAAIIGAALNADEIQIWTDVDGVMTCDPSVIPEAKLVDEMTFREAAELAYFGAKVLHPSTILPAIKKNIPVRVLNSGKPAGMGTVVLRQPSHLRGASLW